MTDTIFAVSSGRPPAAIAVIRISGPAAMTTVAAMAGDLPPPRAARLRPLRDGAGVLLDRALVLAFPGPASATGEDLVELHCHGGRAVVAAVEGALAAAGLRRAVAGEFTRRALTHGRIDLAEAQGLADLLEAETEAQRRAAIAAAEGRVSRMIGGWTDRITLLSARIEALLDFSDEGDVADDAATVAEVGAAMRDLAREIDEVLASPSVERLRDGVRVVIAGPPNAGKSTLLNLLCQREAAIVSPIAGTTRDRIEASVIRGGMAYILTDTAGLTETADPIEAIGVARAADAMREADLLLWLGDAAPPSGALWVHSRADAPGRAVTPDTAIRVTREEPASIDSLWATITERTADDNGASGRIALHQDQRTRCCDAVSALRGNPDDPLLMAENLRIAATRLVAITGSQATDAMLDALFSRFCIGK